MAELLLDVACSDSMISCARTPSGLIELAM
jgi:hypothetical protein